MKRNRRYIFLLFFCALAACNNKLAINQLDRQSEPVFSKGAKITNDNFTGAAYLQTLIGADSLNPSAVACVTFEPGARSKWHWHPAGQILVVIDGVGYYQEQGQPKKILRKGQAIKCPPGVPHWHGAGPDTAFVQLAITNGHKGPTVWLGAVTDSVYHSPNR
jgi:quercetin dioxygenase-like cupin family protein